MSSIGNYRRNFITMEDTGNYILYFWLWSCCNSLLKNFTYINPIFELSPSVVAAIQNLSNFICYGFFYGFVLPIKMTIPWNPSNKPKHSRPFYVRQEKLEPRRPLKIPRKEYCHRVNVAMSTSSQVNFGHSSFNKSNTKNKVDVKYSLESYNQPAPSSKQVFLCDECQYTCEKEITLKKHVNTNHQEVKRYCQNQECGPQLKNTNTMVITGTVTCSCMKEVVCDNCLDEVV
jgi:hypothetical protein